MPTEVLSRGAVECVFDLTWQFTSWHEKQSDSCHEKIMDKFGGSRGLFDMILAEARAFEEEYQDVEWDVVYNYYEEIDTWGNTMLAKIAASIM